jgi:hypothetical protein
VKKHRFSWKSGLALFPDYNRVYYTSITYCFFYCYVLKLSSTGRVTRVFSTHFAFPRHLFGDLGIIQWIPVLKRARRILVCPVPNSDRLRSVFNTFTLPFASVSERSMTTFLQSTLVRLQQVRMNSSGSTQWEWPI